MSFSAIAQRAYSPLRAILIGFAFMAFLIGVSRDANSWIICRKFDQSDPVTLADAEKDRFFGFARAAGKVDIRRLDQVRLIARFDDSCRRGICLYVLASEISGRSISFLSTGVFSVCLSCNSRSVINGQWAKGITVLGESGAFDIIFENDGQDFVILPVDLKSALQFCPN